MHPVFFVVLLRLLTTLMQLFISQMHATLKAALSIGWSVYQLVGWLVAIHDARVICTRDLPCFFVVIFITDRLLLSPWNILVVFLPTN